MQKLYIGIVSTCTRNITLHKTITFVTVLRLRRTFWTMHAQQRENWRYHLIQTIIDDSKQLNSGWITSIINHLVFVYHKVITMMEMFTAFMPLEYISCDVTSVRLSITWS